MGGIRCGTGRSAVPLGMPGLWSQVSIGQARRQLLTIDGEGENRSFGLEIAMRGRVRGFAGDQNARRASMAAFGGGKSMEPASTDPFMEGKSMEPASTDPFMEGKSMESASMDPFMEGKSMESASMDPFGGDQNALAATLAARRGGIGRAAALGVPTPSPASVSRNERASRPRRHRVAVESERAAGLGTRASCPHLFRHGVSQCAPKRSAPGYAGILPASASLLPKPVRPEA